MKLILTVFILSLLIACKTTTKKDEPVLQDFKEGNYYRTSDVIFKDFLGTWIGKKDDTIVKISFNKIKEKFEPGLLKDVTFKDVLIGNYCLTTGNESCNVDVSKRAMRLLSEVNDLKSEKKANFFFFDNVNSQSAYFTFEIINDNEAKSVLKTEIATQLVIDGERQGKKLYFPKYMTFKKQ